MLPISDGILSADADEIREQTKIYLAEQEAEKEKNKRRCRTRKSSANDGSGDGAAGDVYMVDEEAVDDNGLAINVDDDDAVEKQESVIEVQEKSPDQQIKCWAKYVWRSERYPVHRWGGFSGLLHMILRKGTVCII